MTTSTPAFAAKGSQRWLQLAINRRPDLIDAHLRTAIGFAPHVAIEWLSPLASENFVEYSEELTFQRLGVRLARRPLQDFWPTGGPRWDGLARASTGDVLLVEAKAHIGEMVSTATRASEPARSKIVESLRSVQQEIAPGAEAVDWAGTFYQYTNRLAHLHLLRLQNDIPAHLVYVYFLHATDVSGPTERAEYEGALKVIDHYLGVRPSRLTRFLHKLFIDVRDLEATSA